MLLDCPNAETCGGEWEFEVYNDSDGDSVWATPYVSAEPVGQTCACKLADYQTEAMGRMALELAAEAGAPD